MSRKVRTKKYGKRKHRRSLKRKSKKTRHFRKRTMQKSKKRRLKMRGRSRRTRSKKKGGRNYLTWFVDSKRESRKEGCASVFKYKRDEYGYYNKDNMRPIYYHLYKICKEQDYTADQRKQMKKMADEWSAPTGASWSEVHAAAREFANNVVQPTVAAMTPQPAIPADPA